ncbi:unnamed protein product [Caenorhabditis auriculariae]|uniref:Protein alan shepard n=1 Tax=Caenorhabditis auriculariae TaxID=2777116 RepID=A0A8S1HBB2_9PELO|nr:unnamed protein product [Caenorhabditis auriculariae]
MNGTMVASDASALPSTAAANGSSPAEPDQDAIKMFVGQIPRNWNEPDCRRLFETYGPVFSCNILRDKHSQASKGCCFVTYYHRKDAIDAQGALHNIKVIEGMHHPVQMKPADTENRNERKLFIGQLSKRHTEEDVRCLFSKYGQIEDCSVLRDQDGKSRGCAFVTYTNRSCAMVATKEMHHSQTMEGCSAPLVVKFADTQKDKDVKQKTSSGGAAPSVSPVANGLAALAGLNPTLLQQLSMNGQNVQALASLLTLLGGSTAPPTPQPQQPNMLGLLGSASLLQHQQTQAVPSQASTIDALAQLQQAQLAAQAQAQAQVQAQVQAQAQAHQNLLAFQGFAAQQQQQQHSVQASQNGDFGGQTTSTQANSRQLEEHLKAQKEESNNAMSSSRTPFLDPLSLMLLNNQAACYASYSPSGAASFALNPPPFALAGGLAAVKTTSPVAASLASASPAVAFSLGGAAANPLQYDPYQTATIQQYALLANLQATTAATAAAAAGPAAVGNGDVKGPDGANLFIYHLPQDFGDADLLSTFSPFGNVLSAKVFIDKVTNLSKCFGFVSYDNATSAANAIQAMNGFQIGTKRLKVQLKIDRGNPYQKAH